MLHAIALKLCSRALIVAAKEVITLDMAYKVIIGPHRV